MMVYLATLAFISMSQSNVVDTGYWQCKYSLTIICLGTLSFYTGDIQLQASLSCVTFILDWLLVTQVWTNERGAPDELTNESEAGTGAAPGWSRSGGSWLGWAGVNMKQWSQWQTLIQIPWHTDIGANWTVSSDHRENTQDMKKVKTQFSFLQNCFEGKIARSKNNEFSSLCMPSK